MRYLFAAVVRELFNHFIDAAGYIATDCRPEHYALTDMEFMRGHRRTPIGIWRRLKRLGGEANLTRKVS